ncbi:hypothetical protein M089_1047 [Bacteroides ovatus str. 3725 D9 iii]|nr:hypothetical protein M089_1047 [Bacteroides ovatus str. 3725 D9 iii]
MSFSLIICKICFATFSASLTSTGKIPLFPHAKWEYSLTTLFTKQGM